MLLRPLSALAEVILGDFLQRQEAVTLRAVIDEARFERGLDARDSSFVDVGFLLFLEGISMERSNSF
jgi:hypothetical protein